MISGIHALFYSRQAPAARAFLRDVLGLPFVDSGGGWLIFAAPPVELAVHPSDVDMDGPPGGYDLYFMCTNIEETVADLQAKGLPLRAAARREPVQPAVVS
jgi:catechol 2,3-dioxygenase-like lactoylglutathione lyase family enzyme